MSVDVLSFLEPSLTSPTCAQLSARITIMNLNVAAAPTDTDCPEMQQLRRGTKSILPGRARTRCTAFPTVFPRQRSSCCTVWFDGGSKSGFHEADGVGLQCWCSPGGELCGVVLLLPLRPLCSSAGRQPFACFLPPASSALV